MENYRNVTEKCESVLFKYFLIGVLIGVILVSITIAGALWYRQF